MNQRTAAYPVRLVALLLAIAAALLNLSSVAWAAPPLDLIGRTDSAPINADQAVSIGGTVLFRPRYQTASQVVQPRAFLVVLDVTRSMSWNFAGQGTRDGRTIQCGPASDLNVQRRHCGSNAPWRVVNERRIYTAKQALLTFVDQLDPNDTMQLIAFSTRRVVANDAWTLGDTAGKRTLRRAVLDAGKYQDRRYRTAGEAPTASALYLARQIVAQAPQTAPNGMAYGSPVVILLTDSVANSFLVGDGGWRYNDTCAGAPFSEDIAPCQIGYTNDNPPLAKPITAMDLQADQLKQNATIYVITLADVDETGLRQAASAPMYPFFSTTQTGTELPAILAAIEGSR